MRILLVGNFENDAQESMLRYGAWLKRSLAARGHCVELIAPRPVFSRLFRSTGLNKYLGYVDKFALFPPKLRRMAKQYDIVHVLDHSNSMYLRPVTKAPSLITCHDLLALRSARGEFPESPIAWSGRLLQRWIHSGLRGARNVVCDSTKTAHDLKTLTGETGAEVRVVHLPLNWSYRPGAAMNDDLRSRLGLSSGEPYLLHVGGNQWYKNRLGVLRIYTHLVGRSEFSDVRLVMVGKTWTAAMRAYVNDAQLGGRVIEAGRASNEELQALYGNAHALLFPSLEEGFGWPILEAQACGCPVVTSARPPMTEVAGNAAIFVDPSRPEVAAATIAIGLQRSTRLRDAGFQNLLRFNETAILDEYCAFYDRILSGNRSSGQ